jgi:hypothetical protein
MQQQRRHLKKTMSLTVRVKHTICFKHFAQKERFAFAIFENISTLKIKKPDLEVK